MKLEGRTAVITGGGRGIGRAIALEFARQGADVLTFSRTRAEVEATAAEIRQYGRRGIALVADVRRPADVSMTMERALEEFGRIDILVNNAGIQGPIGKLPDNEVEAWVETIQTYLVGTFLCCRHVLPSMVARRRGKIINLSGGGAATPRPYFSAYAAAKAGVVRLTETLAEEFQEFNIQVNAIAPGPVFTRMLEQVLQAGEAAGEAALADARRCQPTGGTPPEHATALAVFLASPESGCLTGRLVSAVWDDWPEMVRQFPQLAAVGGYTLRRIDSHVLRTIHPQWKLPPDAR